METIDRFFHATQRHADRSRRVRRPSSARRRDFFRPVGEQLEQRRLLDAAPWPTTPLPKVAFDWFDEAPASSASPASDSVRWIVRLSDAAANSTASFPHMATLLDSVPSVSVVRGLGKPGLILIQGPETQRPTIESALQSNPNVVYYERDQKIELQQTPNDPDFALQYGLMNTGQTSGTIGADIGAAQSWNLSVGNREVVVAVLDTGIDITHPDLVDNLWRNAGEDGLDGQGNQKSSNGLDDDGNGFIDDLHGYDFVNGRFDPLKSAWTAAPPVDDNGHGTHVAGIIGAEGNNGIGISGVAWQTSLMPLKFLGATNDGFIADAVRAIQYAITLRRDRGVNLRVLNNSWVSKEGHSPALEEAIQDAADQDILVVAAAGNGNAFRRGSNNDLEPVYPASYISDHIISVAAADEHGALVPHYNFGPISVDIAAPGLDIYSTVPGGGYDFRSGTSMAAPHVAGAAALAFSYGPADITAREVRKALLSSVDLLPSEFQQELVSTHGRLNAHRTLTTDTYAPRVSVTNLAASVTVAGGNAYRVGIRFTDNDQVDLASIDNNDVLLRRLFDGAIFPAVPIDVVSSDGGKTVDVTYEITPPGGTWDNFDNGHYEVLLADGGVRDTATVPNGVPLKSLGELTVDVLDFGQFLVNSNADSVDANPGDGFALDASGAVSLRAAIMEANALPGPSTIFLDADRYPIGIDGTDEDLAALGDLDIRDDLTIVGVGGNQDLIAIDLGGGRIRLSGASELVATSTFSIFRSIPDPDGLILEFSIFDIMQVSNGNQIQDGERFSITFGGVERFFEFDADAVETDIAPGVQAIHFSPLDSAQQIAATLKDLFAEAFPNLPTLLDESRIRFEASITPNVSNSPHVTFISRFVGASILDGVLFSLTNGDETLRFEFDYNGMFVPGANRIAFSPSATNEQAINNLVTAINGSFASRLSGNTVIDGFKRDRVLDVQPGARLTLRHLVVRGGYVEGDGGGIRNQGELTVDDVRVEKNESSGVGDGAFFAAASAEGKSEARAVGRDHDGNILIAGWFEDVLSLTSADGKLELTSNGERDIFVAKLTPSGTAIWAHSFGSTYDDEAQSLEVDQSGNVFLTGFFQLDVNFGTDPGLSFVLSSSGQEDAFMMWLDPAGELVWANRFGGSATDVFMGSAIDSDSNVYLSGFAGSSPSFGSSLVLGQNPSAIVLKVNANGSLMWSAPFHGSFTDFRFPPDIAYGIDVDTARNVYVTGAFLETVDFDPQSTFFELTSAGETDLFVVKLDASGSLAWAQAIGGTASEVAGDIAVADDGSIAIAGGFHSANLDFDPTPGSMVLQGNEPNARTFVARFDSTGGVEWARELGAHPGVSTTFASMPGQNARIQVDGLGNIYIADRFNVGTLDAIDLSSGEDRIPEFRNGFYVHKVDPLGNTIASFVSSDAEAPIVGSMGLSVDSVGAVTVSGGIWGQSYDDRKVDLNPDDAEVTNLISAGQPSAFAAVFRLPSEPASARGAGIFSTGPLTITWSDIRENRAHSFAGRSIGGGIYASDQVDIRDSQFELNSASNGGGVYFASADATVSRTRWHSNTALNSGGAIVSSFGALELIDVAIDKNQGVEGSAIFSRQGSVQLSGSTISQNVGRSVWYGDRGTIGISASLINNHEAMVMDAVNSTTTVVNSTVTGNNNGLKLSSTSTVISSTIVNNGTGVAFASVKNSIIAHNWEDVVGAGQSLGGNIIGYSPPEYGFVDGTNGDRVGERRGTVTGTNFGVSPWRFTSVNHGLQTGDVILAMSDFGSNRAAQVIVYSPDVFSLEFDTLVDRWMTQLEPALGPLIDNGGPTRTHLPLPGNPAIDHGVPDPSITTDQRGSPRPVDGDLDGAVTIDAGAVEASHGTLIGRVFADANGNGQLDVEDYSLEGWRVYADLNNNGVFDLGEPDTKTVGITNPFEDQFVWLSHGEFYLQLLPAGQYPIRVIPEPNWIPTSPAEGKLDIDISPGENLTGNLFGFFPKSGSISGQKYHDLDGDGVRDDEDLGLPGWRIFLDENRDGDFDDGEHFAITDAQGSYTIEYEFENLDAGFYPLREEAQQGWRQITPSASLTAANYDFTTDGGQGDRSNFTEITFQDGGERGRWHLTTTRENEDAPDHSYYFGLNESVGADGYVLANARGTLVSPPIDLRNTSGTIQLTFESILDVDEYKDLAQVAVIHGGSITVLADSFNATLPVSDDWSHPTIDLSPFAGEQIQLVFEYHHNRNRLGGDRIITQLTEGEEYYLRVARLDGVGSGHYDLVMTSIGPDLVVRDVSVVSVSDTLLVYRYQVANMTETPVGSDEAVHVTAVLSSDQEFGNSDDVPIDGDLLPQTIASFESITRVVTSAYTPDATRPYLLVKVDGTDVVKEFVEFNNVLEGYVHGPPPDRLEPNDSFAQAVSVNANPSATISHLSISGVDDSDFFVYEPPAINEPVYVAVHHTPDRGRMEFRVYDSQQRSVSLSQSIYTDHAVLTFTPRVAGLHYIEVSGYESETNPKYTLVFNSVDPPDRHESNDSFDTATAIAGPREEGLSIHAVGERDFYRYIAPTTGPAEIRAKFVRTSGDLQLQLYDANRNQIAGSNLATDFESIRFDFVAGATYYIEVSGVDQSTTLNYSLHINGETLPDRFEPNDEQSAAVDWGTVLFKEERNLTVHSVGDEDFFRFVAGHGGRHLFQIGFDDLTEGFELFLYDAAGNPVESTVRKGWFIDNVTVTSLGYYGVETLPGANLMNFDFGNQSIEGATGVGLNGKISGILYDDRNGNRLRDIDPETSELEPFLTGIKVFLDLNNDGNPAGDPQRTTNGQGYYEFTGLGAGVYNVLYENDPNHHQTFPVRNRLTQLQEVKTGNRPQEVALANFNDDEFLDLAVANGEQNNVAIYFNNGAGLFGTPKFIPIGSGPQGLAEGDLDNDGDLDLVASSLLGARITVLKNDGAGNLSVSGNFLIPNGAFSVAVTQLNDDNNDQRIDSLDFADIVATEKSEFDLNLPALPGGKLHLFFGDSGGNYSDHRIINVGVDPSSVIATHLNDDNGDQQLNSLDRLDLVIANFGDPVPTYRNHAPQPGSITVLRNDGDRNFSPFDGTGQYATGNGSYSVESADIDGDKDLDLIVVDGISDGLSILRNLGGGVFGPREIVFLGVKATSVTARDLDDDHDLDLAISNGQSDGVVILHNDGLGRFRSLGVLGVADFPKSYSFSVTTGDVDDDGDLDFAVARGLSSEVTVLRNEIVTAAHRVRVGVDETLTDINFGSRRNNQGPTNIRLSNDTVAENSNTSTGRLVGSLLVDDPDPNDSFTYELIAGVADGAAFSLAGNELHIRPETTLNFEGKSALQVRIRVRDSLQQAFEKLLTVAIADINEFPVLQNPGNKSENEKTNVAFTLVATDEDVIGGVAESLSYTFVSGNLPSMSLNATSGAFSWTPTESQDGQHVVVFAAKDSRNASSANQTVTITVQEVNDPPQLASPGNKSGDEKTNIAFTLSATDGDVSSGVADVVSYSFVSGNVTGMTLSSSTGSFGWTPTENQDGQHVVVFAAKDSRNASSASQTVTITVQEVNDPPQLASPGNKSGDEKTNIAFTLSAADGDVSSGVADVVSYSFVSGNVTGMTLSSSTGSFGWTPTESQDGQHVVVFVAKDSRNASSANQTVTITVQDVNDPPQLTSPGNKSGDEKTNIAFTLSAIDADVSSGAADVVSYSFVSGNVTGMTLSSSTGSFGWTPTESQDGQHVVVFVAKDSRNASSANQTVTITVQEVNDPPQLASPGNKTGDEKTNIAFTLSAIDSDVSSGAADVVSYSFVSGNVTGMTLSSSTGAFGWTPTESQDGQHVLVFVAKDNHGIASASQTTTITVQDVNDPPQLANPGGQAVDERAKLEFTLSATDGDSLAGVSDTVSYHFVAGNLFGMTLNSATGGFSWTPTSAQLGQHLVVFAARDNRNLDSATQSVLITVRDINDPVTDISLSNSAINELTDTSLGPSLIGTLTGIDVDDNPSHQMSLVGGVGSDDNSRFQIDGRELSLRQHEILDARQKSTYRVRVRATDGTHQFEKSFEITVTDVNTAPTSITLFPATIAENTGTSTPVVVGRLQAADDNQPSSHVFRLVAGTGDTHNNLVELQGADVAIRQGVVLDHETASALSIRVEVFDGMNRFSQPVSIVISDVNEPPRLQLQDAVSVIAENTNTSLRIPLGKVVVVDDQLGLESLALTGEMKDFFELFGNDLFLKAGSVLDFEARPVISIQIEVDDTSIGTTAEHQIDFKLNVTDINERPNVSLRNPSAQLAENEDLSLRRMVAEVVVTDDALGTNQVRLTGQAADMFELDAGRLFLRAGSTLNFESSSQLVVVVEVDDPALPLNPESTTTLTIAVQDINEPPSLSLANVVNQLPENENLLQRRKIADVVVNDDALGVNAIILAGTDLSKFEVVGSELFVRAGTTLDFETSSLFEIQIQVDDSTIGVGKEAEISLSLQIADQNDAPHLIVLSANEVRENISGSVIGRVSAQDQDPLQTHSFTTSDSRFEFANDELRLKAGQFVTRGQDGTATVTVTATDSGKPPKSREQVVTFSVLANLRSWQNPKSRLDATGDDRIVPLDALVIINQVNSPTVIDAEKRLPTSRPSGSDLPYFDTNGDGFCTANDVLNVINFLNAQGEGEFDSPANVPILIANSSTRIGNLDELASPDSSDQQHDSDREEALLFDGAIESDAIASRGTAPPAPTFRNEEWDELLEAIATDIAGKHEGLGQIGSLFRSRTF